MGRFFSMSIRWQLLLLTVIIALPAAGIIINSGLSDREDALKEAFTETRKLADNIAAEQQSLVASARQLLSALAQLPEVKGRNVAATQSLLNDILKINPQYINIFIVDQTGTLWASAMPVTTPQPLSVADRRHFINARATGQFSSGEYIIGRQLGKPTLSFAYPFHDARGAFAGVIVGNFNFDQFRALLVRSQLPPGTSYLMLDHQGVILTRGIDPAPFIGKRYLPGIFARILHGPDADTFVGAGLDGTDRLITYRKLYLAGEKTPYLYVLTGIPVKAAMERANRALFINLARLAPFMIFALILVLLIGKRSIVDPISLLQATSRRLADGDLQARVSSLVKGGELGDLARDLDEMAMTLARDAAHRKMAAAALVEKQRQLEEMNATLEQRISEAVAEIRQKDQLLIQQSRLACMGEMINNIAHQWRQPLNNIGLIVQNLLYRYQRGELSPGKMEMEVVTAMDTIDYMSGTIDDFRNFYHCDKQRQQFSINDSVNRACDFLSANLRHQGITVDFDTRTRVTGVGFPNEYSQVLLNILNNAREVLKERQVLHPLISIRVFSENNRAVATLWDNGGGIGAEIMPLVFDPYFSTKEAGKGTGIGLYMSKVIIEQNMEGKLQVRNVDGGAEFRIEIAEA